MVGLAAGTAWASVDLGEVARRCAGIRRMSTRRQSERSSRARSTTCGRLSAAQTHRFTSPSCRRRQPTSLAVTWLRSPASWLTPSADPAPTAWSSGPLPGREHRTACRRSRRSRASGARRQWRGHGGGAQRLRRPSGGCSRSSGGSGGSGEGGDDDSGSSWVLPAVIAAGAGGAGLLVWRRSRRRQAEAAERAGGGGRSPTAQG